MKLKKKEKTFSLNGGHLLMLAALSALIIANSPLGGWYDRIWSYTLQFRIGDFNLLSYAGHPLTFLEFINDALMALFFFSVAREVKVSMQGDGPLSNFKSASLPVIAAVGGVIFPMAIYFIFNAGTPAERGMAIPMATDIAFSLGVLSLFGNRVPLSMKIFLTTLAVADDIIGILVIAFFYSSHLSVQYLFMAMGLVLLLLATRKVTQKARWWYLLLGIAVWYLFLQSGVHATMAGVLLAFLLPDDFLPSERALQRAVNYFILPLFAFANAGIAIGGGGTPIEGPVLYGVFFGLLIGKPVGIFLFAHIAVWLRWSVFPEQFTRSRLLGVALLGGIGFTVSLFIANLSFGEYPHLLHEAKMGVLSGTVAAGIIGYIYLIFTLKRKK